MKSTRFCVSSKSRFLLLKFNVMNFSKFNEFVKIKINNEKRLLNYQNSKNFSTSKKNFVLNLKSARSSNLIFLLKNFVLILKRVRFDILIFVKVEIFVAQIQCNEFFKIQRICENKNKQRKKTVKLSKFEKFSSFEKKSRFEFKKHSFKQFDFSVEKSRFDFKTRSSRHFDFFIFFEHKNFNTLEYIRYDI